MTINCLTKALDSNANPDLKIHYLHSQNDETGVSFADLKQRALGILWHLQQQGFHAGDECILFTDNNEFFIDAFWACLYGGIVPVPVAVMAGDEHRYKLLRIFKQLARPHLYTEQKVLDKLLAFCAAHQLADEAETLRQHSFLTDAIDAITNPGQIHTGQPDDTAFIQFSSGSTSEPKGVVLTHKNILTNIHAIIEGAAITTADSLFSWMPLTHDMGMIGFHLTAIVVGMQHTIMDTATFVRRPLLWLQAASEKRVSILCSPNFGYKHYLKVFAAKGIEPIDLSAVRLIFNGAEPISAAICEQFLSAMQTYGLNPNTMFPVYGLAEASLAVAFPEPESGIKTLHLKRDRLGIGDQVEFATEPANSTTFVAVGKPIRNCGVRITDNHNQPLSEGHVGHIQLKGDNVTRGYYHAPDINRRLFTEDGWLDTGDSGAFVNNQMLITGRIKDIIFVNGLNFYAHDLENILHQLDELELGKVVADGARKADDNEDELITYILYRADIETFLPLLQKVRATINQTTGVEVNQVIPVKRIPKTTSGKIQRHLLTEAYLNGDFDAVIAQLKTLQAATPTTPDTHAEMNDFETKISEICRNTVTDKTIGPDDNLFEIGISSLALAEIHEQLEETYPGMVEINDLFDYPSIRQLAEFLRQKTPPV